MNQGLIYHYRRLRRELIAEALGSVLDSLVIAARYLVDGGPMSEVRSSFPAFDAVSALYDTIPSGPGPGDLSDPRLAVLTAASVFAAPSVWNEFLRKGLTIPAWADLIPARGWAAQLLLDQAH